VRTDVARGRRGRVCIVTPGYLSSTPRVVREADALATADYDVRVVFTQGQLEQVRAFDAAVLAGRRWRPTIVRWSNARPGERWAYYRTGLRHRVAQSLPEATLGLTGMAERAEGRIYPELARAAAAEPADLYIGHYPVGLAAASHAADRHDGALGYDVEDLYADTFAPTPAWQPARNRLIRIERRYVARCRYVSAASDGIAAAMRERYGVKDAIPVYNAHSWADRAWMDGRFLDRRGPALSLFWFSQTIGLDRGIQDAIRAAGRLGTPVQLHVRGAADTTVRTSLQRLAGESRIGDAIVFHPPCPPGELLSRAAEHDVGLALEIDDSPSRRLSVTNKLFLYLTAGLAVAATDLPGQRAVVETCGEAGRLHACGDVEAMAADLRQWANPGALAAAKAAALASARERWNAETEGTRIVRTIDSLLARPRRPDLAGAARSPRMDAH
jgi:hypothetical protein